MQATILFLWTLLSSTLLLSVSKGGYSAAAYSPLPCPTSCKCRPETLDGVGPVYSVNCAGKGLGDLPDLRVLMNSGPVYGGGDGGTGTHVTGVGERRLQLELANNRIGSLDSSQFVTGLNVFSLDISRNKGLSQINDNTFDNLAPHLERLSMDALGLTFDRSLSTVSNLNRLKQLSISHNNRRGYVPGAVEHVKVKLFQGPVTTSLISLKMSHCGMRSLSKKSLKSLVSLEILDLSNNWFAHVPDAVKGLTRLKKLLLFHCYIKKLADFSFTDLTYLESLDLSANHVADIEPFAFTGLEHALSDLRLGRCHLREIPTQAFAILNKLKRLDLSENRFNKAGHDAFTGGYCLTELLISARGMEFEPTAFADQSKCLFSLTIKQMDLSTIPREAIAKLKNLRQLSLENNKILSLQPDAFNGIAASSIRLTGNPLTTIEDHAFRGLPAGLDINLSHTKVSGIEFILGYPEGAISSVDLNYAGLVCRCSMREALNATLITDIYGSCRSGTRDILLSSRDLSEIVEDACIEESKRNSGTPALTTQLLTFVPFAASSLVLTAAYIL
ncbi:leucine-rich repeat and immunoglobulin-like domain-containing nogo receptor-interacting protein 1 [Plakobranchus ocellatus]|uniref:Leucine-rich repeat and immunoglobulin-like domain-containing nogo receptor-interacting protein 1 n=1 Tax=Plakobranchus ocellatus TaxID=259542 RepID=A0AAV4A6I4_9GAST|nr:leucine-rich repeat and immunoglobulin-like domain-containing nogo receptor-interacting protein 1 [Plakobranchus ocellatus]